MPAVRRRVGGRGLRLSPFRGLRFAAGGQLHHGPDLSALVCPPYDVVEPDRRARLLARHPHNMVRLTLPDARDARTAAATLASWVAGGVLAVDPQPCLYVLEQARGGRRWRGVVGAADLAGADDGSVLPHEDVMAGPVADRQRLLEASGTDLEPILLTVDGGLGAVAADLAGSSGEPVAVARTGRTSLRLWAVPDTGAHAAVATALRGRPGLIADGHHRWTAAGLHRAAKRAVAGPGPWDRLLALVVDAVTDPLDLGAVHRTVGGGVDELRSRWTSLADLSPAPAGASELAALVARSGPGTVGLTDGTTGWCARRRGPEGPHLLESPDLLDAEWLHEVLLPAAGVAEQVVSYHHEAPDAVRAAVAESGTAVLLAPVALATVRSRAAAGRRLPRKTTSFSPKAPSGLVLRRHADG